MLLDIGSSLSTAWSVFLIIGFFGGTIFVHELGHFLAARRRGLKIERFSIGFGPKLFGWTRGGVEYRISLLPLGGYVALPQLADMDALEGKPKKRRQTPPISYTSKVIVIVMGAVFNLLFAFVLACILWVFGQPVAEETRTTTIGYVSPTLYTTPYDPTSKAEGPAYRAGLLAGDVVLAIDDKRVNDFNQIRHGIVTSTGRNATGDPRVELTIERDGQEHTIEVFPELIQTNPTSGDSLRAIGILPAHRLIIGKPKPNSPAQKAGLQSGDHILATDGQPVYSVQSLLDSIQDRTSIALTVERDGQTIEVTVSPQSVPSTKPLGHVEILTKGLSATFQLQPIYTPQNAEVSDTSPNQVAAGLDPATPSALLVHDIQDPSSVLLEPLLLGDRLVALNSQPLRSLNDFYNKATAALHSNGPLELHFKTKNYGWTKWGRSTSYTLQFKGTTKATIVPPQRTTLIGFPIARETILVHLNPLEQFSKQLRNTFEVLGSLVRPSSDIGLRHLSGPIGIVRLFNQFSEDLRLILALTILLNINLAILNLLPIPVLDGGHILFATITKLRGKAIPARVLMGIQGAFMVLIFFGLFLYVGFFDISRLIGDNATLQRSSLQKSLWVEPIFPQSEKK